MSNKNEYYKVRADKLNNWRERQVGYPGKFEKTHFSLEAKKLDDEASGIALAGRLMAMRVMGKLAFAHIQDARGKIQIALSVDRLGKDDFKFITKNLDIGDHIGVRGAMFTTQRGEKTLGAESCILLSKGLRPLPEKWHGLQDPELKARFRFLDLTMNQDTRDRFEVRHKVLHFMRNFYNEHGFLEVETPILQSASSGASARPFETHHNALNVPLYMRIAPETYLKRLIAGGYEKVFEIGKCFRNEGIDPSHLQEFTMLESYAAYWDYRDNMDFMKKLIQGMVQVATGGLKVNYQGVELDFSGDWPEYKYSEFVLENSGIDLDKHTDFESLKTAIKDKGLDMPLDKYIGYGQLVDGLYKKFCRPKMVQPCFLTMHPAPLVPLARRSDEDPNKLDMFQVVANGWELVKGYSELVDPVDQTNRLLEQADLAKQGDDEAMMMEEDFLLAMEYGMPPISGIGIGVERITALLTDSQNIRDVIFFPSLKPPQMSELEE